MKTDEQSSRGVQLAPWGVMAVLLIGWTLFAYGYLWQAYLDGSLKLQSLLLLGVSPALLTVLGVCLWRKRESWSGLHDLLQQHTDRVDGIERSRVGLWIAVTAALGLYTELMIIRVHGSYFQLFGYFKNISLLSCFLGLGLGYIMGPRRPLTTPLVLPFLAVQIALMYFLRSRGIATALQNPISEQLTLGMGQAQNLSHVLTAYGFMTLVFAFNALCFVPIGHLTSRLMMRQDKLVAYSWNLAGSLAGILLFSLVSFALTPPAFWLSIPAMCLFVLFRKDAKSLTVSALACVAVLAVLSLPLMPNQSDTYSPYQILSLKGNRESGLKLEVNNVYYQRILNLSEGNIKDKPHLETWADYYALPYYFEPKPEEVLVVGCGTGNDVAAALRHGAGHVDAVEIDPVILKLGRRLHPESPYQSDKVTTHVTDARAYIQYCDKQYDLIVYGLLDSHTLLSGKSGVRLDSYVYTVEAFRGARKRLKQDGLICMTFSIVRPELGRKLYLMLEEAFDGKTPLVYETGYDGGYCFLIGEDLKPGATQLPPQYSNVTSLCATASITADMATDDWPFFYMAVRKYPVSYVVMILLLLAVSTVFVRQLAPGARSSFSGACFFLGAGFMLVETKGITELALVFGSTWIVISAVVSAILILAFLANLLVMKFGTPRPIVTYGLLIASLVVGLCVSRESVAGLTPWQGRLILTTLLTLPLFFSGFAFSAELKKSTSVAVALSSNLLGAMLGGFLEYNSMYFGFRSLYVAAIAMYVMAFLLSLRVKPKTIPEDAAPDWWHAIQPQDAARQAESNPTAEPIRAG